jgi:hypothetical protein
VVVCNWCDPVATAISPPSEPPDLDSGTGLHFHGILGERNTLEKRYWESTEREHTVGGTRKQRKRGNHWTKTLQRNRERRIKHLERKREKN